MDVLTNIYLGETAMRKNTCVRSVRDLLFQFLTPEVCKQGHQAWSQDHSPSRWRLKPLIWQSLNMAWCCGDSQEERFATARAVYVAAHQRERRPGTTLTGFLQALAELPMPVMRAVAKGIQTRIGEQYINALRIKGWLPLACDGTRLECPRSAELQRWLGEAGKTDSAPMVYLTTLVLLPLGLPWSWRWGKGTANELDHLQRLLPTMPERSLIVADAFYLGYELYETLVRAQAAFLVRMSSRAYLYTLKQVPLKRFREGLVYYWPENMRDQGKPPIQARLLRIRSKKGDVWLLTNILDREQLSRKEAAQIYRWRWGVEGLFRHYKRLLKKTKLYSRTLALVHREAEGSLLALQLLLAMAAEAQRRGRALVVTNDSPRCMLLHIRGEQIGLLRSLGPRQFQTYRRMLAVVRCEARDRRSAKVRQEWPRRRQHKPPGAPKIRVLTDTLKRKLIKVLNAA
jgi:hypothetical protein